MGGKHSKDVNIDTSQTVNRMVSMMSTVSGNAKASATATQVGSILIGPNAVVKGNLTSRQNIDLTQIVYSQLNSEQLGQLNDIMFSNLAADVAQSTSMTPTEAAVAVLTPWVHTVSSEDRTNINNAIKLTQTTFSMSETYSNVDATVFTSQTGTITVEGTVDGDVLSDQYIIIKQTATLIVDQVIKQINSSNIMSQNNIKIVQSTGGNSNTLVSIIWIIAIIVILCCCSSSCMYSFKTASETAKEVAKNTPPP